MIPYIFSWFRNLGHALGHFFWFHLPENEREDEKDANAAPYQPLTIDDPRVKALCDALHLQEFKL
jgi:hypothetical protein